MGSRFPGIDSMCARAAWSAASAKSDNVAMTFSSGQTAAMSAIPVASAACRLPRHAHAPETSRRLYLLTPRRNLLQSEEKFARPSFTDTAVGRFEDAVPTRGLERYNAGGRARTPKRITRVTIVPIALSFDAGCPERAAFKRSEEGRDGVGTRDRNDGCEFNVELRSFSLHPPTH